MNKLPTFPCLMLLAMTLVLSAADPEWRLVFDDPGTSDWESRWFLDGAASSVTNTPQGMVLKSGPIEGKDASHAVLWTRQGFDGDVRVEYDFTRLDSNLDHVSVCILYLQATGVGKGPYVQDIFAWRDLRQAPAMNLYFRNMICYHFSYACTGGKDFNYIRARRYPTKGNFQADTLISPSYDNVDLFKPGETWHLAFEKVGTKLTFTASRQDERHVWTWDASGFPPVPGGRIGLRQMLGRESRYANFKVFQPTAAAPAGSPKTP